MSDQDDEDSIDGGGGVGSWKEADDDESNDFGEDSLHQVL